MLLGEETRRLLRLSDECAIIDIMHKSQHTHTQCDCSSWNRKRTRRPDYRPLQLVSMSTTMTTTTLTTTKMTIECVALRTAVSCYCCCVWSSDESKHATWQRREHNWSNANCQAKLQKPRKCVKFDKNLSIAAFNDDLYARIIYSISIRLPNGINCQTHRVKEIE